MIDGGADIDSTDDEGRTPLLCATSGGVGEPEAIVWHLLQRGANLHLKTVRGLSVLEHMRERIESPTVGGECARVWKAIQAFLAGEEYPKRPTISDLVVEYPQPGNDDLRPWKTKAKIIKDPARGAIKRKLFGPKAAVFVYKDVVAFGEMWLQFMVGGGRFFDFMVMKLTSLCFDLNTEILSISASQPIPTDWKVFQVDSGKEVFTNLGDVEWADERCLFVVVP